MKERRKHGQEHKPATVSEDGWCYTRHRVTELHGRQTESCLIRITGHLVSVKHSVNCVCTLSFCSGKESTYITELDSDTRENEE